MSASEFPIHSTQYVDRNQNSFRPTHFIVASPAIIIVVAVVVLLLLLLLLLIIIIIMQSVLRQVHSLHSEICTQCDLVFQFQIIVSSLFLKGTQ